MIKPGAPLPTGKPCWTTCARPARPATLPSSSTAGPGDQRLAARLGKEPVFVGGLRQTDAETLDVAVMALAGKVNTDLVAVLQGGEAPPPSASAGWTGIHPRPAPDGAGPGVRGA